MPGPSTAPARIQKSDLSQVTCPGPDITLFTRTMTTEAYRHAPLPDKYFMMVNPANIDAYHAAIARELAA